MKLELKDYIKMMRKRVRLILALVVVSTLVTGIVSYTLDPVYEASTKLIVNKSSELNGQEQIDLNSINLNLKLVDTYKEVIKTPRIMDKVAEAYPQLGLTSEQLIQKISVSSVNNTQVMTLTVSDASYEKAVETVNAISKIFQEEVTSIMKVENVAILNEAKLIDQPVPVKPNPVTNMVIALILSLLAGTAVTLLLHYLDDTLKTEEDIAAYLDLPTVASIIRYKDEDMNVKRTLESTTRGMGDTNVTINK